MLAIFTVVSLEIEFTIQMSVELERMYFFDWSTSSTLVFRSMNVDFLLGQIFALVLRTNGRGSIVVKAHASRAEGLRFESDSMP